MSAAAAPSPQTSRFKGPRRHVPRLKTTRRAPGQPAFVRPPNLNAPMSSHSRLSMTCSNTACPEPNIIEDDGRQVCATCGVVARESNIVSELQFGETSSGAAAVQGSYVAEGRTHGQSLAGPRPGLTRDGLSSREVTTLSARREIDSLINNLRIPQNLAEPAVSIFKLSLAHAIYDSDGNREKGKKNFVQGRSIRTVAAVALYIACRRQKSTNTIMLIDLAETMTPQVSVFKMGNIYNHLVRAIWGNADGSVSSSGYVDPINPENLIRRFARDLEFGSLVGKVTEDAIRLVQRMDRDWMTTGRRPAGICGAALILAARMNNFRRTVREVVLVVKVCEVTVNNRLEEFRHTDSSELTVQQMRRDDHTNPSDPPSFSKTKVEGQQPKKRGRKRKQKAPETAAEIEDVDGEAEQQPEKRGRVDKDGFAIPDMPIDPVLRNVASHESPSDEAIAAVLTSAASSASSSLQDGSTSTGDDGSAIIQTSEQPPKKTRRPGRPRGSKNKHAPDATNAEIALEAEIEHDILDTMNSEAMRRATPSGTPAPSTRSTPTRSLSPDAADGSFPGLATTLDTSKQPPGPNSNAMIKPQQEAMEQIQAARTKRSVITMDPEILEEEFEDDPEIANVILSEQEVLIKEHIWVDENKQWLRDEHAKRIKKQLQDAADIAAGLVPGQSNKKKRRRGRRLGDVSYLKGDVQDSEGADVDGDQNEAGRARRAASIAMKGMLEQRGYSRRLNYDALKKMFPDDMASVEEGSVESRRTIRRRSDTGEFGERSISAGNDIVESSRSRSATSKAAPASPQSRRVSATSASALSPAQLSTHSATQPQDQTLPSDSPPTTSHIDLEHPQPLVEGQEELVGVISESDSPLSLLQPTMVYNSPIGAAQGSGFGAEPNEDDNRESGESEESEEDEEDPHDYMQDDDDVEQALQGRYRHPFGDDEDEEKDE